MITSFGSLYAGHVDMDDIGFQGIPVNSRRLPDDQLATVFEKAAAIAKVLDESGFDIFWLAEHHFQREGHECIPNIPMLAVHLAHLTEGIKFGCAFNVAPMWHPLRLAEDYAAADILTGGRLILGVGRGYHTREVETFGAPLRDSDANRELFEEQVEIVLRALNEPSFSFHGKYYDIPPRVPYRGYELEEITLVPKSGRPVECWQPIVSASRRGVDFMAKYGMKGFIGGAAGGDQAQQVMTAWRDALLRVGREAELGTDLAIGIPMHVADTEEKAIAEASAFFEENVKVFAPLGFVRDVTQEQLKALEDPVMAAGAGLPTLRDAVKGGAWLCGPPERIVERLEELQAQFPGLEHVSVGHAVGTPQSVVLEQLAWFGKEVIPAFDRRPRQAG